MAFLLPLDIHQLRPDFVYLIPCISLSSTVVYFYRRIRNLRLIDIFYKLLQEKVLCVGF